MYCSLRSAEIGLFFSHDEEQKSPRSTHLPECPVNIDILGKQKRYEHPSQFQRPSRHFF
jgi:hypothetical protein